MYGRAPQRIWLECPLLHNFIIGSSIINPVQKAYNKLNIFVQQGNIDINMVLDAVQWCIFIYLYMYFN